LTLELGDTSSLLESANSMARFHAGSQSRGYHMEGLFWRLG